MDPKPEMFDIEDIAHALSNICRFSGHCRSFYSVAEHSIYVSRNSDNRLAGLLHDASEAYLIDVPRPVKPYINNYKDIESKIMAAVAEKFGFVWPDEQVHHVDKQQLGAEAAVLMPGKGKDYGIIQDMSIQCFKPLCLPPTMVKEAFFREFYKIGV